MIVAASGYFEILHAGHVEYLQKAKQLAGKDGVLVVILNSDEQCVMKKGKVVMDHESKRKILSALRCVDIVFSSIDTDSTVCKSLRFIRPDIFAKGGDRFAGEVPEMHVCAELGIQLVDGLGEKIDSSRRYYDGRD
jgi:cytidyltransferase-like protein